MKKFLFIMILFGAMLVGGVAYADDGKCFCNKVDKSPPFLVILQQVTLQKDFNNTANCKKQEDEINANFSYDNCYWIPAEKSSTPKPTSGGAPSGSGASAGTGGISAAPVDATVVELENPLGAGRTDIREILGSIIKYAMGILGSLTLLVFVWGGFLWLTSAGNDERVKKGSQAMLWAVIGIFIIFASYGILTMVFNALGATKNADSPWGSGTVGGPETQEELVKQLKESQCVPTETFFLQDECLETTTLEGCQDMNDAFGYEVCTCEADGGIQKVSESEYCGHFLDNDMCINTVQDACKIE